MITDENTIFQKPLLSEIPDPLNYQKQKPTNFFEEVQNCIF